MSIASAITAAQGRVADCYTAISNKGGTLPATQNLANMPTAIGSIPTGGTIDSLTVTPTTSQQTITATGGVDGYSPITVNAVTSSIDANISAGNIKSGVSILGVSGSVTELVGETRSVSLTSSSGNTFTPTSGKNGITSIKVTPNNQARSVTPSTSSQTLNVNSGYSGNGKISVSAVTSSIDNNITAGNIKKNVTILGVTGTYEGGGSGTGIPREVSAQGVYQMPSTSFTFSLPSNATNVGLYGLYYAFNSCTSLTSVDLSSLTTVSGGSAFYSAFYGCTSLTSVDLSSLNTISGTQPFNSAFSNCTSLTSVDLSSLTNVAAASGLYSAFNGCTSLTSVDLSSLTTISGISAFSSAFSNCTSLTSVDLSSLNTVSGSSGLYYAFNNCTSLTSVDLSSLTTVSGSGGLNNTFRGCTSLASIALSSLNKVSVSNALSGVFYGCTSLTSASFPALKRTSFGSYTNQFGNMLSGTGTSVTHTLHFPSNLQTTISGLTGYPRFGGTSGYVTLAFDLPATS